MDILEKTKKKRKSHHGMKIKFSNKVVDLMGRDDIEQLRLEQFQTDLKDNC